MNLTELAKKAVKKRDLPDDLKNKRAVRQKLQRLLEEMPEAEKWYRKPGKKGDWDIPADAADRIIDSPEFWQYVAKRKGQECRELLEAARKRAAAKTAAQREWMEERAGMTAADAQGDHEGDPFYPSAEKIKEEETRLLLCGIVGLLASSEGKAFSYDKFKEAHSHLIDIRADNACMLENDHELCDIDEMAQIDQEKTLSDLRNFFF